MTLTSFLSDSEGQRRFMPRTLNEGWTRNTTHVVAPLASLWFPVGAPGPSTLPPRLLIVPAHRAACCIACSTCCTLFVVNGDACGPLGVRLWCVQTAPSVVTRTIGGSR